MVRTDPRHSSTTVSQTNTLMLTAPVDYTLPYTVGCVIGAVLLSSSWLLPSFIYRVSNETEITSYVYFCWPSD